LDYYPKSNVQMKLKTMTWTYPFSAQPLPLLYQPIPSRADRKYTSNEEEPLPGHQA